MTGSAGLKVLAVAGSLRRGSYNHQLAVAAASLAPPGMTITVFDDLASVPLFNEDAEADGGPAGVRDLRAAVAASDALIIATPEYNQSLPGVTKNLVDWLSRGDEAVLDGKPVAIMGATRGPWGTRLSQSVLRHTLGACNALVMPTPQVYVRGVAELFDADGALIDDRTRATLTKFLAAFALWIAKVG
ncbi:MAG TPA: NADPH-dependent FMN reductase [Steroidobacteraceae bacterium]|nr:NADPH-dependent FMN reductase [Steroidobacteraceae bacterium]